MRSRSDLGHLTRTFTRSVSAHWPRCGRYSTAMTNPDELIEEFIGAWNAGKRPRVDDYLERAPADQREHLAGLINAFLDQAPTPAFSQKTFDEIKREPT